MVRGFAGGVKPRKPLGQLKGIAEGTLLFCGLGLTNVREEARMRGAKFRIVGARLVQAQLAVHRQADIGGVLVFLAVVLPPADWTQPQGAGRVEGFVSTAGATIADFDCGTHTGIDGDMAEADYAIRPANRRLHGLLMSFWLAGMRIPR